MSKNEIGRSWNKKQGNQERHILNSIKSKVIAGFILFALSIGLSWLVVRHTNDAMMVTIDKLYSPNYKMKLVDDLFRQISELEQSQRAKAMENPNLPLEELLVGTKRIRQTLDTLLLCVMDNHDQISRIDSMKNILDKRDKLFIQYLKLRAEMEDNTMLGEKIDEMSRLMSEKNDQDSNVIKTERRVTTTTYFPEERENELTFFERLFNSKKVTVSKVPKPDRIVRKEENIKIDTIARFRKDSILDQVVNMMGDLRKDRQVKKLRLNHQEFALLNSSGELIRNLMQLSHEVQEEEIKQEEITHKARSGYLQKSLKRYGLFIVAFFVASGVIAFLILFDISRSNYLRKALEKAKEDAERLGKVKQRFLANMSHEIRTPLQSIIGFSEQMIRQPKIALNATHTIYHSSQHLLHLVNEVLDFSKLQSDTFDLNNQPFNMALLLREIVDVFNEKCRNKRVRFIHTIDFNSHQKNYSGDAFRLRQILYNLLDNAIKFTTEGKVELAIDFLEQESSTEFIFRIRDSGIGIPENARKKIFQQFEQINQGNDAPQDGIGLGLSIVQALVNAKGGLLKLDSTPGHGSTFTVRLCYEKSGKGPEIQQMNNSVFIENGKTDQCIFMVDDDAFTLDLCEVIFTRHKLKFHLFNSIKNFLSSDWKVRGQNAVFLIDLRLSDGSGKSLSKEIKEVLGNGSYTVASTAQLADEEASNILEWDFDDVLLKPFTEDELLKVIGVSPLVKDISNNGFDIPDMTNLLQMAGNDMDLVHTFIDDFVAESRRDIESLSKEIKQDNKMAASEYLHRLAGRCGHLGAQHLAANLRKLETMTRENTIDSGIYKSITLVISRLEQLNSKLREQIVEQPINKL